ncbi:hypothetical protein C2G38_2018722 [Gigaspora rosea]|uniref:Serine-threonine/tyrosine-protein kinase catalytic domain-containing protein n=1 Tax=Gigaspora rosea TaxID=44941 RepID=A0A397V2K3_9GLOM|nr:hypothetical protein C2G38_2018722 [Gigaspora rosea]
MVEITTGQRPFNDFKFDKNLAMKIFYGLRPNFGPGIPDCYIELANHCMDSDPEKRPKSREIIDELKKWLKIIGYEFKDKDKWIDNYAFRSGVEYKNKRLKVIEDEVRNKIKSQFLESDEINKKLPLIKKNRKNVYTSKPYNITEISKSLLKLKASKTMGIIEIPDDN